MQAENLNKKAWRSQLLSLGLHGVGVISVTNHSSTDLRLELYTRDDG